MPQAPTLAAISGNYRVSKKIRPIIGCTLYQGHVSKMNKVEGIIQDLENRHGESKVYSVEQIRVWAHMIQMKQHTSYETHLTNPFSAIQNV